MNTILWKLIRFFTSSLGYILIGFGITAILFGFIADEAIDNFYTIDQSANESAREFIEENRDLLRQDVLSYVGEQNDMNVEDMVESIDVEQLRMACNSGQLPEGIPEELCEEINGLSDQEFKDLVINKQIDQGIEAIVEQTSNLSGVLETGLKEGLNLTLDEISDKYVKELKWGGVFLVLFGILFIFISRKFKLYPSLYSVAVNFTLNIGMFSAMFWVARKLSTEQSINLMRTMAISNPQFSAILEVPKSIIQLILKIVTDWIFLILEPILKMSMIFTGVFFVASLGLYMIMRAENNRAKRVESIGGKLHQIKSADVKNKKNDKESTVK